VLAHDREACAELERELRRECTAPGVSFELWLALDTYDDDGQPAWGPAAALSYEAAKAAWARMGAHGARGGRPSHADALIAAEGAWIARQFAEGRTTGAVIRGLKARCAPAVSDRALYRALQKVRPSGSAKNYAKTNVQQ
jgi:hypothetical protein